MEASWYRFALAVVIKGTTPSIMLEVAVDGSLTAVKLELAAIGGEVDLLDDDIAPDVVAGDGI